MWHRLSLRMRILLGYGVGLAIMAGLVALLLIRLEHIKAQMIGLNTTSASEAQIGAQLASRAALAQQAVNRYLQRPQDAYLKQARRALDEFAAEIKLQQTVLTSASQQARAADLGTQLTTYHTTFDALHSLLNEQMGYRSDNARYIIQASALTSRFIYKDLGDKSTERLNTLITLQSNLQAASTTAGRMVTDQDPQLGYIASTSLYSAKARLQGLNFATPSSSMQDALHSVTSAISATAQLATNITELNRLRSTNLVH